MARDLQGVSDLSRLRLRHVKQIEHRKHADALGASGRNEIDDDSLSQKTSQDTHAHRNVSSIRKA